MQVSSLDYYILIIFITFFMYTAIIVVTTASDNLGFFCKVGPLSIYVSRYAMPEDIVFDEVRADCWVSNDGDIEIREGSVVRLRIMGLTLEANSISATGTIKDDYLGLLEA